MRVLAGGPAREVSSPMFEAHREGLEAQSLCHCGGRYWVSAEGGPVVCRGCEELRRFALTIRHEVAPDPGGPRWHHEKIERVAKVRQAFMRQGALPLQGLTTPIDIARGTKNWDALLLVDTDVILGPGVLERMWQVEADVVYGVFFTEADWGNVPGVTHWPQVWDRHAYQFTQETWDALNAPGVNEVEVLGGGACTLIRGRGFESRYWPLLKSISHLGGMFVGEDRTFALGCETRRIKQIAITGLPIYHCHHPHQQTAEGLEVARKEVGLDARTTA